MNATIGKWVKYNEKEIFPESENSFWLKMFFNNVDCSMASIIKNAPAM